MVEEYIIKEHSTCTEEKLLIIQPLLVEEVSSTRAHSLCPEVK